MRVAHLTTWGVKCGISEYVTGLIAEMAKRQDNPNFRIFANISNKLTAKDGPMVSRIFTVRAWDGNALAFKEELIAYRPDVLHIQYQATLYRVSWLNRIMREVRDNGGKVVVTFHDSAIPEELDFSQIDQAIVTRPEVGLFIADNLCGHLDIVEVPLYTPEVKPVIATFGIGRSDRHRIRRVCNNLGYKFKEPKSWLTEDNLIKFLKSADAVVLWYYNVGIIGSSAAAKLVIACNRPLYVKDIDWFSDIKEDKKSVIKCQYLSDLEEKLAKNFNNLYKKRYNLPKIAQKHIIIYNKLIKK